MKKNNVALVPLGANAVAGQEKDPHAYTQELFLSFRQVFSAQHLRERAIFWFEEKRGRAIVRHVRDPERQRKSEDQVIGMTVPDINAVRILIGNFTDSMPLSTVRWELYQDFDLTELNSMGRFDHIDLLSELDQATGKALQSQGIIPYGHWDFDQILLTHLCPLCGKIYDRRFLIYVPHLRCESCSQIIPFGRTISTAHDLVKRHLMKTEKVTILPVPGIGNQVSIQDFIDPAANSFAYWLTTKEQGGGIYAFTVSSRNPTIDHGFTDNWMSFYYRSLFHLMKNELVRDAFNRHLETIGFKEDEFALTAGAMHTIARLIEGGENAPPAKEFEWFCRSSDLVQHHLPTMINKIILKARKWADKCSNFSWQPKMIGGI